MSDLITKQIKSQTIKLPPITPEVSKKIFPVSGFPEIYKSGDKFFQITLSRLEELLYGDLRLASHVGTTNKKVIKNWFENYLIPARIKAVQDKASKLKVMDFIKKGSTNASKIVKGAGRALGPAALLAGLYFEFEHVPSAYQQEGVEVGTYEFIKADIKALYNLGISPIYLGAFFNDLADCAVPPCKKYSRVEEVADFVNQTFDEGMDPSRQKFIDAMRLGYLTRKKWMGEEFTKEEIDWFQSFQEVQNLKKENWETQVLMAKAGKNFFIDPKTVNLESLRHRAKAIYKQAMDLNQLNSERLRQVSKLKYPANMALLKEIQQTSREINALLQEGMKLNSLISRISNRLLLDANDMELVKSLMADGHLRIEYTGTPNTEEQPGIGVDALSGQQMVQPSGLENSSAVRSFPNPLVGILSMLESDSSGPPQSSQPKALPVNTGGLGTMGQRFCACAGPGPFTLPTGGGPPGNVTNGAGSPWFDNGGNQNQVNQVAQNVVANASTAGQVFMASNGSSSGGGSVPPPPPPPPPPSLGSLPFVFQVSAANPLDIGDVAAFSVVQLFVSPVPPVFLSPTQVTLSGIPQVLNTTVDPGSYQIRTSGVNFGANNQTNAKYTVQVPPTSLVNLIGQVIGPTDPGREGFTGVTPAFPTSSSLVFTVK
ncbi:MAG: hypothetical protein AB7T38_16745 [Nitrospirales bacterium]